MFIRRRFSPCFGNLFSRLRDVQKLSNRQCVVCFSDQQKHLSRTGILVKGIEHKRMTHSFEASIRDMYSLSPSVKGLKLLIQSEGFTFKAGQWVDFLVPNITEVAGYSICSSPIAFEETREIELAIKSSHFPPTKWIHEQCQIGEKVGLVVGGDFYYDPKPDNPPKDLLLIAGGVGINPLISIMRNVSHIQDNISARRPRLVLAYSACSLDELIFKDEICKIVTANSEMKAKFYITRHHGAHLNQYQTNNVVLNSRINREALSSILQKEFEDKKNVECYVCGPSSMIDDVDANLIDLGLSSQMIKYEKWW